MRKVISKAKMKAAICCSPLARRLLALNAKLPKTTRDYICSKAKLNDDPEIAFYEQQLIKNTGIEDIPAICKRLAYHLEVFAFAPCKRRKSVCDDLRAIGRLGSDANYLRICEFEPKDLIIFETGEVMAEY
jgi:hypothetical protein